MRIQSFILFTILACNVQAQQKQLSKGDDLSIGLFNEKYFKSASESGLKYYFIEHEAASDPLKSIAQSIDQLKEITH